MTQATTTAPTDKSMDDIVALCKRRGFVFPASEIYGGINGFWDYGPLGVELKNNLRDRWWRDMVTCPPDGPDGKPLDIVGVDSAIIQNPKVWEASGHVGGFNDPMVDDTETKQRFRADQLQALFLLEPTEEMVVGEKYLVTTIPLSAVPHRTVVASTAGEAVNSLQVQKSMRKQFGIREFTSTTMSGYSAGSPPYVTAWVETKDGPKYLFVRSCPTELLESDSKSIPSPFTGKTGVLTPPRQFNLMYYTYNGAIFDEENKVYLRPETAQGIFTNFKNVVDTSRVRVPFGIAQIGKSFRNEVTPRNFIFRSREFEQMEMEWFCHESEAKQWYDYWVQQRHDWWVSVGVTPGNLQKREHDQDELAHYSTACADVEYQYPFTAPGFGELEGIAHRGNYDLTQHQEHARQKLEYFDQQRNEKYLPHVIEPAAGLTRGMLVLLCEAYTPDDSRPSKVFMKFEPSMAPIKAAIFPLVNKDGMPEKAEALYRQLRSRWQVQLDVKQNIGKRYARMDEAGTPFCFTIDGETMSDDTVTVRHRDDASQQRINISQVEQFLEERIGE